MKLPPGSNEVSKPKADYLTNKVPSRSHEIPVPRYYKILRIEEINHRNPLYRSVAFGFWKRSADEEFSTEEFMFRISPLFNKGSNGPDLAIKGLKDSTILIESVNLIEREYEGKPYSSYSVKWALI